AVSPAKTRSDATPDRTIHFRALDSVIAKTATLETSIGASNTRKNTPSSTTYGRTCGPSQPGMSKMAAAWISTTAVSPPTYGPHGRLRGARLAAAVDERQDQEEDHGDATEEVAPERRAELRLEGRAGPDRELREDIGDLQQTPGEQEVPVRDDQLGDLRAPRRAEERRDDGGQEEHDRDEEEDQDEGAGRLRREERDPGLVVGPDGPVLPGESRHPFHDFALDVLDLHGPPQWGSATPCNPPSPIWRILSPVPRDGRQYTFTQS